MAGAPGTTSASPRRGAGRRRTAPRRSARTSKARGTGARDRPLPLPLRLPLASESCSRLPSPLLAYWPAMPSPLDLGLWVRHARAVRRRPPGRAFGQSALGMVPIQGARLTGMLVGAECCSAHASECGVSAARPHPPFPLILVWIFGDAWVWSSLPRVLVYLDLCVACLCFGM